jgi:UDP-galactopyranose mutase
MKFKYVIVGAGLSGLTMAERIANELKEEVLLIEKRNQIGGNCSDYYNEYGILVHKYGPHIFHTNYNEVWAYLSKFTKWHHYQHKVLTYIDGRFIPIPICADTINELYNLNLSTSQVEKFLKSQAVDISDINNSEEVVLSKAGSYIYEKFFKNYTKKQWDKYPDELDKSVISRIPVRYNRDSRYFEDKYQGLPKHGYTKLFDNMADNSRIHILLNTDYKKIINEIEHEYLIYTGAVDYFFDYKFGPLKYRCLDFEHETLDCESYQSAAVVNYPNDYDFTRITEFKKLTGQAAAKTTICREYPSWEGEPHYPVPTTECAQQFELYKNECSTQEKTIFIGRLAEYKYYNMDAAVKRALDVFNTKFKRNTDQCS